MLQSSMENIGARVLRNDKRKLQNLAAQNNTTLGEYVRQVLTRHVTDRSEAVVAPQLEVMNVRLTNLELQVEKIQNYLSDHHQSVTSAVKLLLLISQKLSRAQVDEFVANNMELKS